MVDFWYRFAVQEPGKTFAEVKIVYLKRIPFPTYNELSNFVTKNLVNSLLHINNNKDSLYNFFITIVDAIVFNLYFPDHMKERGIDVLEFVGRDIDEVMQGREFEKLSDTEKEQVIETLHAKWSHPDNEVRNRIKLFAVRSPEILKPILES